MNLFPVTSNLQARGHGEELMTLLFNQGVLCVGSLFPFSVPQSYFSSLASEVTLSKSVAFPLLDTFQLVQIFCKGDANDRTVCSRPHQGCTEPGNCLQCLLSRSPINNARRDSSFSSVIYLNTLPANSGSGIS